MTKNTMANKLPRKLFCSLYHVDDGIDWQDIQCKLGTELVRKEIIYVTKEDIQMPGLWVRDRSI